KLGLRPVFKQVDTCAAEFEAQTPYLYSTYEQEDEAPPTDREKVIILGGGPNRIGQGIEFDYCCVHGVLALSEAGYEAIMVNCNPETVSTDYDTSDLLFFEPLTLEDVLNVYRHQQPVGAIVQLGGQTPLNIAKGLEAAGVRILGTSPDSIDIAEDRERCAQLLGDLGQLQAPFGLATDFESSKEVAERVGYPVMVRPSYVLGGRAMEIVYDESSLERYLGHAVDASPEHPVLIDRFLEDAIEVDVDAISDGERVVIGGILEHIEEAGIHSGDSSCTLPAYTLSDSILTRIREMTKAIALALEVKGLVNIQFAVKSPTVYVLEVNPRASRTVPFVSKATGVSLARIAARVMMGARLDDLGFTEEPDVRHISVKKSVFPFSRFPGVDIIGGPEMRSTGEVMGIADDFGTAFAKAQMSASLPLPLTGKAFLSVKDSHKREIIAIAKRLRALGFEILATRGTHKVLVRNGVPEARLVKKVKEGRPNVLDIISNREVGIVINTPSGKDPRTDEAKIRALTVPCGIPCITTLSAAAAALSGIEALRRGGWGVRALQDYYSDNAGG
ncbi:MAG: carbamoyl-phosphate synthase large subunit, partial [Planctomycetota bacterium]|nr:carbamoyl-phosphate synthase large subunit [Planctomycetota bacterium]